MMDYFVGTIGVVIDSKKFSPFEVAIEKFQGGQGYHAFVMVSETELVEAHWDTGVTVAPLEKYIKGNEVVLMATPTFLKDCELQVIRDRAHALVGREYDKKSIFRKVLGLVGHSDGKEICSEAVARVYEDYFAFLGLLPEDVLPSDIVRAIQWDGGCHFDIRFLQHKR